MTNTMVRFALKQGRVVLSVIPGRAPSLGGHGAAGISFWWDADDDPATDRMIRIRAVRGAVETLDLDDQLLLYWKFWRSETQSEIARVFHVDQATVSRRLADIYERLRPRLLTYRPSPSQSPERFVADRA
jgi:DNA-directed RNA polymerase specialized sigma24 family protein